MNGLSVVFLLGLVAVASAYPKQRCICTYELLPLCASNGVTYQNTCAFECDNQNTYNNDLKISYFGQCEDKSNGNLQQDDSCVCTKEFFPVCGSNGVTYSNQCSFRCDSKKSDDQGVYIVHKGVCKTS